MIQRHHQYVSDDSITKLGHLGISSLTNSVKQQQLNSRTCSEFDLHNLSYTISPSVDYHSFSSPYYSSPKSFNTSAYSYVSENFLHSLNINNHKPSHSSLAYSPVIDRQTRTDKNYLSKLTKRKQLFLNKSEMQCDSFKMASKLSTSTYFDPESLVSYTLQSNVKKPSKSTPCLNQQTSPVNAADQVDLSVKKNKRKSAINWPFKRSSSSSTVKPNTTATPFSIQQHTSKTVSMLHKKLLSKSQSNLKSPNKSTKSTLSIMSNVTLKRTSNNKKQTIKLFGQSIGKLCIGDRHLIAPVKNMLIELMQRAPQTVGIFRKSANARVCRELKAELEQNPDCDLREYPIIVIASVFKELLRSLPDCLLVGKLYSKWLEVAKLIDDSLINNSDCSNFIRPLIKSLPKANHLLLQHFLCILHYIAIQSAENKMSAENLAVCIGPTLLLNHDLAPASMHCELSKQVPKLISYLIKNCSELFGANTLTLFEAYQNVANENKENEMKEKDSGAEESDSLNSLHELNNNCKTTDLNKANHHYKSQSPTTSTFSSFTSVNNSINSTLKIFNQKNNNENNVNSSSNSTSSASISSTNNKIHPLPATNNVHQSYYVPMLSQQTVNKVSLSNLSRDSGLTLSDTQLYSPEEDYEDCDDYQHILAQHLHLSKKLNNIVSDKCISSNKNQFKINSTNKITNNSTSLKKKCNSKMNRLNATSSEDELHDELEDVDIDELSDKSCASENSAPLYSRVYNKQTASDHNLLTKSAPQLANIDMIASQKKAMNDKTNRLKSTGNNKITCTTIPLYLHSIKNNSLSTSTANSSCNSPSSVSNLSSTSLNLLSSNDYSASDLQRNYFMPLTPDSHLASTPIIAKSDNLFKSKQHVVTISASDNHVIEVNPEKTQAQPTVCNVSINKENHNASAISQKSVHQTTKLNNSNQAVPPSYQETMNRKEINARMANLIQSNTSRKISDSEIDNLISKKIYEKSLRVYNADVHKDLTLRAVPVHIKNQSSDSESDWDQYPKRKITNSNTTVKLASKPVDQVDGFTTPVRIKPIIQQNCAKDQTEYWKKDANWSVATLRNKFTELCKQNECSTSTLNRVQRNDCKANNFKSISSIYDLCKSDSKVEQSTINRPINKLRSSCLSQSSQLLDNNKSCVTIIHVMHGKDKLSQTRSSDSLSGEESYV